VLVFASCAGSGLLAAGGPPSWHAELVGVDQPGTPASTTTGTLSAQLGPDRSTIAYELKYEPFTTPVLSAYIDLSLPGIKQDLVIVLCGTFVKPAPVPRPKGKLDTPDGAVASAETVTLQKTQGCTSPAGQATGVLTAADVIAGSGNYLMAAVQLLARSRGLGPVVDAIQQGDANVVIQTQGAPAGEIRGPIKLVRN
jgi:hypothetical protein